MEVDDAFDIVNRQDFLPDDVRDRSGYDIPLPIGFGQTNSQPSTVRRMLIWLDVQVGQKVLDIGSGSGWTTALLGKLVGTDGHVYATEIVPQLVLMGDQNCDKAGILNVDFYQAEKTLGLKEYAPYDRILVSASANKMPIELLEQLDTPGKLVVPVGETIYEISKDDSGGITQTPHRGYVFVPLL